MTNLWVIAVSFYKGNLTAILGPCNVYYYTEPFLRFIVGDYNGKNTFRNRYWNIEDGRSGV